jgi:hypothetical protein
LMRPEGRRRRKDKGNKFPLTLHAFPRFNHSLNLVSSF